MVLDFVCVRACVWAFVREGADRASGGSHISVYEKGWNMNYWNDALTIW